MLTVSIILKEYASPRYNALSPPAHRQTPAVSVMLVGCYAKNAEDPTLRLAGRLWLTGINCDWYIRLLGGCHEMGFNKNMTR
jgi:hypothetical protein